MYEHISQVLVEDCRIAEKLEVPVWMDRNGCIVDSEEQAFGCKVDMIFSRPDLAFMMDEVGCNTSQEKDGRNGGEKYVCGVDEQPYVCSSTKSNHFTCLGLTSFDGEPVMCIVIIAGKTYDLAVEIGIDWKQLNKIMREKGKNESDIQFFEQNYGDGKAFPGGPRCQYKGKEVSAFVTFTEGGGMDGWVLTEILRQLDSLELFDEDRENGTFPFLLLDGHQSRFDVEFLSYINAPEMKWEVCLGVPYGTALWQVADSSEQNGIG